MMLSLVTVAFAAPPDGWQEVRPAELTGGLLDTDAAWLHTPTGCLEVSLRPSEMVAPVCATEHMTCEWRVDLDTTWGWGTTSCELADGSGTGSVEGGSNHARPRLVIHDARMAVWRHVVTLVAAPERHLREDRPCTPKSMRRLEARSEPAELERRGIVAGMQQCNVSEGVHVYARPAQGAQGVGIGITELPDAVDCTLPCPPNDALDVVRARNAELRGRLFTAADDPVIALFVSEALCEASQLTSTMVVAEQDCLP
jgi:hypothetical protein